MNVGKKLTLSITSIIIVFIAINVFTIIQVNSISSLSKSVAENDMPAAFDALNMLDELGDLNGDLLDYILGEKEATAGMDKDYGQFNEFYELLIPLLNTPEDKQTIEQLAKRTTEFYNRSYSEVFNVYDPEKEVWAVNEGMRLESQYADPIEDILDELLTDELEEIKQNKTTAQLLNTDIPTIRLYYEMMDETEDMLMDMLEYLTGDPTAREGFEKNVREFDEAYSGLIEYETKAGEVLKLNRLYSMFEKLRDGAEEIFETFDPGDKTKAIQTAHALEADIIDELSDQLEEFAEAEQFNAKTSSSEVNTTVTTLMIILIIITIVVILLGVFLLMFNIRGIVSPLKNIVDSLDEISTQVASASGQLSSTSQELANGAAEQASSLEEISNSMAQLSSMVTQNSENSRQVSQLSGNSSQASQLGFDKMSGLLTSMNELSTASDEIKNIINVIDGIAFQTNMLALNAAVEAARAGEAGMGFAVVADEVKNLANKSADSAQSTAMLIEDSIKKIQNSLEIAGNLSETFKDILQQGNKVEEMSRELEASSEQQEDGILQINQAIAQLEKVVQSNAASAEEAASSAEELDGQSGNMTDIVDNLVGMVSSSSKTKKTRTTHRAKAIYKLPAPNKNTSSETKELKGEELIPFEDDEEYTDF